MQFVSSILSLLWTFINSIHVPLLGITFGQLFISLLVITLSITILQQMLGLGRGGYRDYVNDRASARREEEREARRRSR